MKLDQATLEEYGLQLMKLKLFPYFDIAHYILMCLVVRDDIHNFQSAIPNFHKRHPLACYLSSMLSCFGGGMLVHFLLGEPVLDDFKTHQGLALATVCWYLVFFSPFDAFYKLVKFLPVKIVLSVAKELQRVRKIQDGVVHASHIYPDGYIVIVLIGALKGSGSGFLTVLDRLNRGFFLPNSNEILHPSFATKGCLVAAALFTLERKAVLDFPRSLLFIGIYVFFAYVKVMSLFIKSFDPFIPFENLTAAVFFGGIIDAFKKAQKPVTAGGAKSKEAGGGDAAAGKLSPADADAKKSN